MGNITNFINNIKNAVFGKDVRQSICDAIMQCYEDAGKNGNANMEVVSARSIYDNLNNRLNADKNSLETQINALQNGSPLVASSISEMTNTDRVYINTSDCNWYYFDGISWKIGRNISKYS